MKFSIKSCLSTICLSLGIAAAPALASQTGAVFVATNHNNTSTAAGSSEPANQVVMYRRANDGTLSMIKSYATGGQGSGPGQRFAGDGLGSSHSVQLSHNKRWLFVTNAGSDTLSLFEVRKAGLKLRDVVPTGDGSPSHRFPNSVTQHGRLVYVLNGAGNGSITGFRLRHNGSLVPIPYSTRELAANQTRFAPDALFNPTQVSFTPDGRQLVVSIKDGPAEGAIPGVIPTGPGRVLVFGVDQYGRPSQNFTQTDFDNRGPFGFSFDRSGNLLVALFIGGPDLTGAAGSFRINSDNTLTPITPLVDAAGEVDLCWLENNGRYAYGANYTTGVISSFRIGADGSLTLLEAAAGLTDETDVIQGSTPLDLGVSADGQFLYNVLPGSGAVAGWQINHNGSLTKIGEFGGLGQTINGDKAPFDFSPLESPAGIAVY
ncbi:MAG: beta-propeller fold lactonase family protein [Gammaproteobacteria bacterium]|nr:beta-propeller fold lactonase family protein [Gammaproteobacteria bacterium]